MSGIVGCRTGSVLCLRLRAEVRFDFSSVREAEEHGSGGLARDPDPVRLQYRCDLVTPNRDERSLIRRGQGPVPDPSVESDQVRGQEVADYPLRQRESLADGHVREESIGVPPRRPHASPVSAGVDEYGAPKDGVRVAHPLMMTTRRNGMAANGPRQHERSRKGLAMAGLELCQAVVLRVAWTLSDLAGLATPGPDQVAEALGMRLQRVAA